MEKKCAIVIGTAVSRGPQEVSAQCLGMLRGTTAKGHLMLVEQVINTEI